MNTALLEKLQKVHALTTSPIEGEAAAAAAMLQRLLTQHNLDMADLEQKGAKVPGIEEKDHDLGKAAFKWKLDLAEMIAAHFFTASIVDRRLKTVIFVGRPDNVESMKMLYGWLIEQIKQISSVKRKDHEATTGEHIDPLRWQVSFGVGVVERLQERLDEIKRRQQDEAGSALVIHHQSEISDHLEAKYGYRTDGRKTKAQEEREARWAKIEADYAKRDEEARARKAKLKEEDIEEFYRQYPEEKPKTDAQKKAQARREEKESSKYWDRYYRQQAAARRREENLSPEERRKREQAETARVTGNRAAKEVNLEPFLKDKAGNAAKIH